ncbi:Xanthine and CO dehydrogenase maturation factor, XdhC/CoxF family [Mucilaginibacter lappiensis]|uniref:Xanthine/CO dehydrogenase XdhC/CoxF family maturation factor n=1 Tax=Mucilaginibacter lappiensis TaxID=354630 RepID=A0ABR6PIK3_9SPHI|nr:XdhC/CoxI family protein [Mucilaginibacter lappiensis]MBB6109607.1 xanthine/CO dehydrogenase XdhC/CoxF family maturation factor [Mucilaginibacter lappiensis]SIR09232.1 Xanthine and CO dehydrogenase maturation factor, XdhC/CoxF family [Mucilaginibacter lappiensis]
MKELQDIVQAFDRAHQTGKQTALATVVHVEGSSYRRAGARMLITEDGQLIGAISGGCLEGDALRKARLVMAQNKPMLVTYDTTDDDDAKFGVGLGCNGIIHILIEPISATKQDNPIQLFKLFLSRREPVVLITIFTMNDKQALQPGTCLLLTQEGNIKGIFPDDTIKDILLADANDVLINGNSVTKTYVYGDKFTCFIELLQPTVSLVIFGAGNDAIPLVQLASVLGWHIYMVDGRSNYAIPERFPLAKKIITAKPENALSQITIDERTVIILMTHNYNYDLAVLKQLLPLQLPYVGALGPKKRLYRMLDELKNEGMEITDEHLTSIYGPAGLDIGSENADEIALSIIAEMQAVLKNRTGTSLRYKNTIHNRHSEQIITQTMQ